VNHNRLLLGIFIGAIAGIACGWLFGEKMIAIGWIGQFFLDALKMTIIPLVVAAIISSVTSIGDLRKLGRFGSVTLIFYLTTSSIAVMIGLFFVNLIEPGVGVEAIAAPPDESLLKRDIGLTDMIRSLVTPNLVSAAAETQLLPIIVFCLMFATALTMTGQSGKPVSSFFDGLNEVMMRVVMWLIYLSPIGIFALIAAALGKAGGGASFSNELAAVGRYVTTVLAGLAVHFLVLLALLVVLAKRGHEYLLGAMRALLTAFGTASSSATMPLTLDCAVKSGVDRRAAKLIIPLGATVNMDGTALYQAVAAMFIAQAYGLQMGLGEQAMIFVTATLAAIGTAGIPQAGLVTLMIVFGAVNLPTEGIGLILAVDWFVDRCRTMVNVWGDSVGAAVVERIALGPRSQSAVEAVDEVV
jgi:Na+/H+-dicarboxylate symporter